MKPIVFPTASNPKLVEHLIAKGGFRLGQSKLGRHRDGEIYFELFEQVADLETIVIGSSFPPAENLLELFTVVNTLKLNKAKSVTLVVPYMGYMKADRLDRPNLPVNIKLFIEFLEKAGVDKVIALDLHSQRVVNYFSVPLVHLSAMPLMADYFKSLSVLNFAVTSPDLGDVERAKDFAHSLGLDSIVAIQKYRPTVDTAVDISIEGDPKGKNIVIADDLIQTGGTLIAAAETLKSMGAKKIFGAVTHFVYSGPVLENLIKADVFEKFITTDSIPTPEGVKLPKNFTVVSAHDLFLSALK